MRMTGYGIGEVDQYLFGQGKHFELHRKLGSHPVSGRSGYKGVYFAVWAPHAASVSVVGDFNEWDPSQHEMLRVGPVGIYELFIPEARPGQLYKYCVTHADGRSVMKADPLANEAELRPGTASRITDLKRCRWGDRRWMKARSQFNHMERPVSVFECHIGSWKRHPGRRDEGFYNYREFADAAIPYIKEMHYTHIELMGILEHPFDGSWGYQVTGYYAPTSRYGTPEDFAYMVDRFHRNGIGVILDWVPAHFPKDEHGLAFFDGTPTYEPADPLRMDQPDWNTHLFDFEKNEVRSFLISSALFWVEVFHIDGLRVDAVASMLYLDFGKKDGHWRPNRHGGNVNEDAVSLMRELNTTVLTRNPGVLMIAEESTTWPLVTWPPDDGGLGYNLKWNMGWMHDFLEYMKRDPYFRKDAHNTMTFASSYAYSENFILVLSHDEVVHMKGSMYGKVPGNADSKIANLKAGYAFMTAHPGKKLLFMGQEFGQIREWSEDRELDWRLLAEGTDDAPDLSDPIYTGAGQYASGMTFAGGRTDIAPQSHTGLQNFVSELFKLYRKHPALYEQDCRPEGLQWINADDGYRSIYSFVRHSKNNKDNVLAVINFTPVAHDHYRVGVPVPAKLRLILDSQEPRFLGAPAETDDGESGGSAGAARRKRRKLTYRTDKSECDGQPYSIAYPLPAYGVAFFEYTEEPAEKKTEAAHEIHKEN